MCFKELYHGPDIALIFYVRKTILILMEDYVQSL
jgi:hypothetical protein